MPSVAGPAVERRDADWWKASAPAAPRHAARARQPAGGRFAFRALVAFTVILIAAPQEHVAALAPLRIALLAAVAAVGGYWIDRWTFLRAGQGWPREWILAAGLVLWAVATIPLSYWPFGSVNTLVNIFGKSLVVFWLLGVVINTEDRLRAIAWTLALVTLPLSATAIAHFGETSGRISGYQSGVAGNPNDLALMLVILVPLMIALASSEVRPALRLVALGLALLAVAAIVATFSRGGFVALVVMAMLHLVAWLRQGRIGRVVALVLVTLLALPLLPGGYAGRLETITAIQEDPTGSAQERWRDTIAAVEIVARNPVVGAGLGQDILAMNEARGATWLPVHNVYLEYAVDLGLPGLVLFVGLFATTIQGVLVVERRSRWQRRDQRMFALARAVRISLMTFAVAALFHPVAYYFYFYYLAGLAVAVRRIGTAAVPSARTAITSARGAAA